MGRRQRGRSSCRASKKGRDFRDLYWLHCRSCRHLFTGTCHLCSGGPSPAGGYRCGQCHWLKYFQCFLDSWYNIRYTAFTRASPHSKRYLVLPSQYLCLISSCSHWQAGPNWTEGCSLVTFSLCGLSRISLLARGSLNRTC